MGRGYLGGLSEDDRVWLCSVYPLFSVGMLVPAIFGLVSLVLVVLFGVFGEAGILGKGLVWFSGAVLVVMCWGAVLLQLVFRWRVLSGVVGVDSVVGVIFRCGSDFVGWERGVTEWVAKEWKGRGCGMSLAVKLSGRFPWPAGGWFGEYVVVTFGRDGEVKAEVGGVVRVVRGVARGGWCEVSLVGMGLDEDFDGGCMDITLGLVEHELAHVPLGRMFPGMTGDAQHELMLEFL